MLKAKHALFQEPDAPIQNIFRTGSNRFPNTCIETVSLNTSRMSVTLSTAWVWETKLHLVIVHFSHVHTPFHPIDPCYDNYYYSWYPAVAQKKKKVRTADMIPPSP